MNPPMNAPTHSLDITPHASSHAPIAPFGFVTAPRIAFGEGESARLATHAPGLGERVLMVTDPGIVALGLHEGAAASLGPRLVAVHDDVGPDPTRAMLERAIDRARDVGATGIVGLGGGSPLDVAKLTALVAGSGEALDAAWGVDAATGPRLPLALVPTTAGTGSEVTPVSIITVGERVGGGGGGVEKRGVSSPWLLPDVAVLDPALTYGLPRATTAATGIDAMVHAIEAYASRNANNNPVSKALAREALRLLGGSIEAACEGDRAARAPMLLGSMLAGQAFANSPVAAVHALAYPLGGRFKVPHGLSNAVLLPHVLAFNAEDMGARRAYADLAPLLGAHGSDGLIARLDELAAACGLAAGMRALGVSEMHLDAMAADAMRQTRLLVNNPRPVNEADARAIYEAAL